MAEIAVAHTADVAPDTLRRVRSMLDRAFAGSFSEHDWDHALGGVHCIAWEGDRPIGHAAVVARRLLHGGRTWRTGYVEAMAVEPDRQGAGLGGAVMAEVDRIVNAAYEVGALAASEAGAPLYRRRGWTIWPGPLSALTPEGIRSTPDEARSIYVLDPAGRLDPAGELTCDWRDGDVW